MKNQLTIIAAFAILFTAFAHEEKRPAEQTAAQVVTSLQQSSTEMFTALLPTIEELQQLMDKNASVYGANLEEARQELSLDYTLNVLPTAEGAFETLILEGKRRGIEWSNVRLVRVITPEEGVSGSMTIVLASGKKEFNVQVEKAMLINGQWKISQFVKLI